MGIGTKDIGTDVQGGDSGGGITGAIKRYFTNGKKRGGGYSGPYQRPDFGGSQEAGNAQMAATLGGDDSNPNGSKRRSPKRS